MNVHKLTSANRPRALGRVRRVGRFMRDVWVGKGVLVAGIWFTRDTIVIAAREDSMARLS
jgi:hypothetical protein